MIAWWLAIVLSPAAIRLVDRGVRTSLAARAVRVSASATQVVREPVFAPIVRGFRGQTAPALTNGVVIGLAASALGVPAAMAIDLVNVVGAYVPCPGGVVGVALDVLMALGDGGLGSASPC